MESVQDLVEEAKKRAILWIMFALGVAYLLSLTSNSIWFNIPTAAVMLAVLRYLSFELEIRKRVQGTDIPLHLSHLLKHQLSPDDPLLCTPPVSSQWRRKMDSPIVEAAVDDFTHRIVREFLTDLWYSALSPDQDVPEQLCLLINDIFGEIAQRVKRINLINLLTRDVVDLVANHLELFRQAKVAIGVKVFGTFSSEEREENLKLALLRKSQLHPAILSPEFECKVLQQLMSGVVAILLRPQDAQCALMRGLARELLACAVLRPVMNFASPGFINNAIEKAMLSAKEKNQDPHMEASSRPLETQLQDSSKAFLTSNRMAHRSLVPDSSSSGKEGDWAQVLDVVSQRRTRTLAPENLDNLWAKGRNYKRKEFERALAKSNQPGSLANPRTNDLSVTLSLEKQDGRPIVSEASVKCGLSKSNQALRLGDSVKFGFEDSSIMLKDRRRSFELPKEDKRQDRTRSFELPKDRHDSVLSGTLCIQGSLHGEVTGSGVNSYRRSGNLQGGLSNIEFQVARRSLDSATADAARELQEKPVNELPGTELRNQNSRALNAGSEGWQKLENSGTNQETNLDYWDAPAMSISTGSYGLDQAVGWANQPLGTSGQISLVRSSASKLNCWVVGAHLVKAESKTFAVYSIAVTDSDNNTWFVERRFRNFEQLHRYLRDLPQYNLPLPPKRFLSSSLDDTFVRDRCILLDKYLKDLLSIPSIAELHEVWDFLSVSSKNYAFSKPSSVMKTLAVNVDDAVDDMFRQLKGVSDGFLRRVSGMPFPLTDDASSSASVDAPKFSGPSESHFSNSMSYLGKDGSGHLSDDEYNGVPGVAEEGSMHLGKGWHSDSEFHMSDSISNPLARQKPSDNDKTDQQLEKRIERLGSDGLSPDESTAGSEKFEEELAVPPEWTPPKLTVPLLNLVDSIFQLQRRGWIRRQVFWMAKQILQLGMGDAVDDWMVTQIQYLRREDVVASSIRWVQETLWPGGVFITKAKKGDKETSLSGCSSSKAIKQAAQKGTDQSAFFESQLEASRCAHVVHEILVEGGPAALVSLVGRRQYRRCAKDIYYFLQSTVFLKQLTYSVLETLLVATFPELTHLILDIRQGSGQVVI